MRRSAPDVLRLSPESTGGVDAHLLLGVTPAFAADTARRLGVGPDARTVDVAAAIQAATGSSRLSLAESWVRDNAAAAAAPDAPVAEATLFVSHAQSCGFWKLLSAVDNFLKVHGRDPAETFLWLDLFVIRQHDVAQDVRFIGQVERAIGHVAIVTDPWDEPVCLSRVWCLYEVLQCQLFPGDIDFRLAMAPGEQSRFQAALQRSRVDAEARLTAFDCRRAEAFLESDKAAILSSIRESLGPGAASLNQPRKQSLGTPGAAGRNTASTAGRSLTRRSASGTGDGLDAFNAQVRAAMRLAVAAYSWSLKGSMTDE